MKPLRNSSRFGMLIIARGSGGAVFGYVPVQPCDTQTHSEVTRRCDSRCSHTSCLRVRPADVAVSQSVDLFVGYM